jgi:hypothetical protein
MKKLLKNHRTLFTLLGLWATPFFVTNINGLDKKGPCCSQFFLKILSKTKKKVKSLASFKSEEHLSVKNIKNRPPEAIKRLKRLKLKKYNSFFTVFKTFYSEGFSKKQSGLSPPFVLS